MKFTTCFIVTVHITASFLLKVGAAELPSCSDPAEVGSEFSISCTLTPDSISKILIWELDGDFKGQCMPRFGTCMSGHGTLSVSVTSDTIVTSNMTIESVDREDEGVWMCQMDKTSQSCDLRVYAKPENVSCSAPYAEEDNVVVTCRTERVYPHAVCVFYSTKGASETETIISEGEIVYHHSNETDDNNYYTTNCTLKVSTQHLDTTSVRLRVVMYPNVTGHDTDHQYGTSSDLTLPVEIKHELPSCSAPAEVGSEFSTSCTLTPESISKILIWELDGDFKGQCMPRFGTCFSGHGTLSVSVTSDTIVTSNMTIESVDREDEGVWMCHMDKTSQSCDLRVYAKPENVSCSAPYVEEDSVVVTCRTERVYPHATCVFYSTTGASETETIISEGDIVYHHSNETDDNNYYTTNCTLKVSTQHLDTTSVRLRVVMYPNVTGHDTDQQYGTSSDLTPAVENKAEDDPSVDAVKGDDDDDDDDGVNVGAVVGAVIAAIVVVAVVAGVLFFAHKKGLLNCTSEKKDPPSITFHKLT